MPLKPWSHGTAVADTAAALATALSIAITQRRFAGDSLALACRLLVELDALRQSCEERRESALDRLVERIANLQAEVAAEDTGTNGLTESFMGLCETLDVRRALVSTVESERWLPEGLYLAPDLEPAHDHLRGFLEGAQIPLRSAQVEHVAVRRRIPRVVESPLTDRRTFKPLMQVSNSHGYAVAPVVARGLVLGLVHIDRHDSAVTTSDLDDLAVIGEVLALAVDEVSQRRRIAELAQRAVRLVESATSEVVVTLGSDRRDVRDGADLDRPLSQRENQVLTFLAAGDTNAAIAERLGVAEVTVKSHVSHLLRKLGVANRAEAAAWLRADAG